MESLFILLQQGLLAIVPMIILLGLLIFVHELGHFLVAKYYGVRVEVFSLGFGKKLLQVKRGDTTYCLSMIPLGGYVKMFGDDPSVSLPPEEQSHAFLYKPVPQKMAIVLAGPLMNLFFALFLFTAIAMIGEQVASSNLGDVKVGSAAYEAGFRSGDRIVSINGEEVQTWKDVKDKVLASAEVPLSFTIERHLETGQTESLTLESTPKRMANENVFSTEDFVGDIEGFSNSSRASTVGIIDPTSVAHIAGLRTGDTIMKLNGIEVDRWRQLIETIPQQVSGSQLNLLVMRQTAEKKQPEELPITIDLSDLNRQGSGLEILKSLGIEYPDLYLSEVIKESPAEKAGLRAGDKILAINSEPINSWDQVLSTVSSYQKESGPIQVKAQRGSAELNFEILPKMTTQMNEQGAEIQRFTVGIVPAMLMSIPDNFELRTLHPGKALVRGSQLTWHWTKFTLLSFLRLIQNRVSAKNISGVISIGQVASRSFQVGMSAFLTIMAIISINLFVLNLLPIPILDGGHLVFFTIEALRGAPLSMKKLEMAQQVGLVLLLGLMAFALFNDVTRLLNFSW